MAYAFRSYFVDADDTVQPVSSAHYNRVAGGLRLPRYAGRTVRSAHVAVEWERGRPTGWVHEDYVLVRFGPAGEVDRGGALLGVRLALEHAGPDAVQPSARGLAATRSAIASLGLTRQTVWHPDEPLRARILALARGGV